MKCHCLNWIRPKTLQSVCRQTLLEISVSLMNIKLSYICLNENCTEFITPMAIKRPKPEEIVVKLRQVEVLMGQGMPRIDAIRQISVTEQTYYRWKKKYGGMGIEQLKELKRLQKENERLRRAVSDLTLDKLILKEAASGNF